MLVMRYILQDRRVTFHRVSRRPRQEYTKVLYHTTT